MDFYPRSPCGERPADTCSFTVCQYFYPRSPCGERPASRWWSMTRHRFLSTLSLRRATDHNTTVAGYDPDFYPRSPCGERPHRCHLQPGDRHFYPRSPCGERQVLPTAKRLMQQFLSTLSLRRATGACSKYAKYGWVFLSTLSLRRATYLATW